MQLDWIRSKFVAVKLETTADSRCARFVRFPSDRVDWRERQVGRGPLSDLDFVLLQYHSNDIWRSRSRFLVRVPCSIESRVATCVASNVDVELGAAAIRDHRPREEGELAVLAPNRHDQLKD